MVELNHLDRSLTDADDGMGTLSKLGRRFEQSLAGEALISVAVTVAVLIGVVWNLPSSQIKQSMLPALRPIAATTSLQQNWQMYAPEPISAKETVEVRVGMADGPDRIWAWKRGGRLIGPFAWYHWQKLKEQLVRESAARPGVAHWVVRELTAPGERPVSVRMVFRNEDLPRPGRTGPNNVTVETLYYEKLDGRT